MRKYLATLCGLLLCCALASAQDPSGGIKGSIVSRIDRTPIQSALLTLRNGAETVAETISSADGAFQITGIPDGDYSLTIKDPEHLETQVNVTVSGGAMRNLFTISMTPVNRIGDDEQDNAEDASFEQYGHSDSPAILTDYGYSGSQNNVVYFAGVNMEDAVSGGASYQLWAGLNEMTRNSTSSSASQVSRYGSGRCAGVTNYYGTANNFRGGLRGSVITSNSYYRLRLMLSYGSGLKGNGWSWAFNASTRLGGNDYVKGVFYRCFALYAAADKQFDNGDHLSFAAFASPTERGAQNASTQEVYDLMGDNLYNSNWGYQNGKLRNSRVRKSYQPVVFAKYDMQHSDTFQGSATLMFRFGYSGYETLGYFDTYNPKPDYYRNLPSYYYDENPDLQRNSAIKAAYAEDSWRNDDPAIAHMNWDNFYLVNSNNKVHLSNASGTWNQTGNRSKYYMSESRTAQRDLNLAINTQWTPSNDFILYSGASGKINRTEYYSVLTDLLGGDFYCNIDQYADRDDAGVGSEAWSQYDLDYYLANGHTKIVNKGDRYGSDYAAHVYKGNLWASAAYTHRKFNVNGTVDLGYVGFQREGLSRTGLFAGLNDDGSVVRDPWAGNMIISVFEDGQSVKESDLDAGDIVKSSSIAEHGEVLSSRGRSKTAHFMEYSGKIGFNFYPTSKLRFTGFAGYHRDAPTFWQAFLSPGSRNTMIKDLEVGKTFASGLKGTYSSNGYSITASAYYTSQWDLTSRQSFWDDIYNSYLNFSMTGISQKQEGVSLSFGMPLFAGIYMHASVGYNNAVYTSNPNVVMTVDNSAAQLSSSVIPYWKSHPVFARDSGGEYIPEGNGYKVDHYQQHYLSGIPQWTGRLLFSYNSGNWHADVDLTYNRGARMAMSPLYRMDDACSGADNIVTPAEVEYMCEQEEFDPYVMADAIVGRTWFLNAGRYIGFNLVVNNMLNNRNIKTGGFEQSRLVVNTLKGERYYKFDNKYFYNKGITYMFMIYLRF